ADQPDHLQWSGGPERLLRTPRNSAWPARASHGTTSGTLHTLSPVGVSLPMRPGSRSCRVYCPCGCPGTANVTDRFVSSCCGLTESAGAPPLVGPTTVPLGSARRKLASVSP